MTELIKGLLNQMSTKFNESTSSELVKSLDYQDDRTLKWKSLVNNNYAKKDRKNRKKDGEESVDDKSELQQQLPPCSSDTKSQEMPGASSDENVDKKEVLESPESSKESLIIEEKFGNVKEKKIVIDDDLHTREQIAGSCSTNTKKASDDEKNISTNLPQLNSQAIESTKATTVTATDKKSDDNTVMSKVESVGVALSEDDKKISAKKPNSNSKTIDKTTSPRTLRSNRIISTTTPTQKHQQPPQQSMSSDDKNKNDETTIKSDLDENEAANEDSSATNDTTQSSSQKKIRGRAKMGPDAVESELEMSQRMSRRLRSIVETVDEKKSAENDDGDVKKEDAPKRRGRSRKLMEEKEDEKSSETQNEESQHQIEPKNESQEQIQTESESQDQNEPKRKRGKFGKKNEADSMEDNKSEVSTGDDVKPRLLMTINLTDKSAVPKIVASPSPSVEDQEKNGKKRGRRPKATSITKPIQVKKSLRLAKEGDVNISEDVSPRKELAILAPPIGRIRSQRRIKPTAKILANEELRQGFEVTNCKRLSLSNENLVENYERSPTMKSSGNETSSNKSLVISSPEKSPPKEVHEPEPIVILATVKKTLLKSRDPQEFINEIKSHKIGSHRSPEDNKKLTKSQQKRLIKAKEKHLGMLGLRPKNGQSDSSDESSTSDDFVPTKPSRSRPPITLRLRNQRAAEMMKHKAGLRKREQEKRKLMMSQAPDQMEIDMSDDDDCVLVENNNKENSNINFVCSCHQKTKYCISQNDAFATNGKMFCCAIDEIESRKIGCTNELTESVINLFRPSVKVSYMALCMSHKKRLVSHNCCSGCGIFCTQGTFVICSNKHFFHRNCATKYILNTPYDPNSPNFTGPTLLLKCPHCGIDAPEFDYRVTMRCENLPVFVQHRSSTVP